ncbi:MAG: hypothetical protein DCC68_25910 [Planctomycetota bacterium]|nr:MAG: hypothetical protein DCC68_25910 [Planctomycetota bacterium]
MKKPGPETTLREFLTRYFDDLADSSRNSYATAINSLVAFVGHEVTLAELNERTIGRWIATALPKYSPQTGKTSVDVIRALWRRAAEFGAAAPAPAKQVGIPDYREPVAKRVRHADDAMAVWTLFEVVYRPAKLAGKSAKAHSVYRAAIKWLCYSLGRPARLSDLTPDDFRAFYSFCADRGLAPATIENHRQRLATLLWFAFDSGIVTERPYVPHVDPRDDGKAKPSPWNEPGTLAHFYANTFKPEALRGMRAATLAYFDAAVRAYLRFAGGNVKPESISQDSIAAFATWLREAGGYSAFVIDNYPSILTRIWRQHSPQAAPRLPSPIRMGAPAVDGSLLQFYERDYLGEHPLRSSTDYQYRLVLRRFGEILGRETMLSDLTPSAVNAFLVKRLETKSPRTVKGERTTLLVLWRSAFEWGHVADLPRRIRKVKADPMTPDAFTPAELSRLLAATADPQFDCLLRGVHVGRFLRALIMAGYDTGLRRGDLLSLTRSNLHEGGMIVLTMEKTRHVHTCIVRPETLAAIEAVRVGGDERLLPWNVRPEYVHRRWRQLLRVAGLPADYRNGLQKLRRTSATALERVSAGSAAWHLGHKTPGMAAAHYLDPAQCSTPMLPPAIPAALQDAKKRKDDAA